MSKYSIQTLSMIALCSITVPELNGITWEIGQF